MEEGDRVTREERKNCENAGGLLKIILLMLS
jgi:hypothetical protein